MYLGPLELGMKGGSACTDGGEGEECFSRHQSKASPSMYEDSDDDRHLLARNIATKHLRLNPINDDENTVAS
jgi:hypothetical protein